MKIFIVLSLVGLICAQYQPEQVHLALTGNPDEMMVSWVTYEGTSTSTVQYGVSQDTLVEQATGSYTHYYLPLYESPALHTVKLEGLKPNTVYYYKCGDSSGGWSQTFYFTTENPNPVTPKNPLKIAIMADNGATSNSEMVLNAMSKADQSLHFDLLILSGDLSYANGWQPTWDYWGNLIQPLASHFPFMVAPGNHELFSLFIAYNARFTMPNNGYDNLYYSFNYRNVHVLILNSMSVNEYHWSAMYQFAEKDLKAVNKEKTPWIFAAFHHPWYCSNLAHNDSAWFMKDEYEDLFHKYNVNLVLQGHVHAYERTYSVYKWKEDETGAVYVTNGHAGNGEGLYYGWQDPQPSWSAYRESVYGFSTIEIFNNTHLHWQMIRGNDSLVSDDFWFVKP